MDEHDFARLRAEVEQAVAAPPFEEIERRGSRIRRRRMGTALVGGAAVIAGVAVFAAPAARIVAPQPSPTPTSGAAFAVDQVDFVDARTGYVVLNGCSEEIQCLESRALARTTDAGRTWQQVPPPPGVGGSAVSLAANGPHDVSVLDIFGKRHVSHDAGRTWQDAPLWTDGPPVDTVPAGYEIALTCSGTSADCAGGKVGVADPISGMQRPLRHQPRLSGGFAGGTVRGRQVWALGIGATSAPPAPTLGIAHSSDGGRTWQTVGAPPGGGWFRPEILAAPGDDGPVYLVNHLLTPQQELRVWRLADVGTGGGDDADSSSGGRWVSVSTQGLPDDVSAVQVLPNGELRFNDNAGNAWQTEDGATRLTPAPRPTVDGARINVNVAQEVAGVLVAVPVVGRRGDRILFSTDAGQHWQVRPITF